MTATITDLASYRAAKKRAERAQAELDADVNRHTASGFPRLQPLHADEFTHDELVDLRKLFMEE